MCRRVTVVGFVCVCVCMCPSVCLLHKSHLTSGVSVHHEILSRTQQAMKVKKFVGFSLKPLHCRDFSTPSVESHTYSFSSGKRTSAILYLPRAMNILKRGSAKGSAL